MEKKEFDGKQVRIHTEFIRLDALLKLIGAVNSGGEGKLMILEGKVTVNGEPCLMRGKKLRAGDRIAVRGVSYLITGTPDG